MRQKRNYTRSVPPYISGVIDSTREFIQEQAPSDVIRLLCEQRLDMFQEKVKSQGFAPSIDVPYLLSYGLTEDAHQSESASVLCTLLYLGCDLLDDLHDRGPSLSHDHHSTSQITLVASLLLSTLPTIAVTRFFGLSDPRGIRACQMIAESLRIMARGQSEDIRSRFHPEMSIEEVKTGMSAKSGEEMVLFCRLAFLFADRSVTDLADQFGRPLAMALQAASDLSDLFETPLSEDLKQGTFTLPLAFHYVALSQEEKSKFLRSWKESSKSSEGHRTLCAMLKNSGALARTASNVEADSAEAKVALNKLSLNRFSEEKLQFLIDKISGYIFSHIRLCNRSASDNLWDGCRLMGM